MNKQSDNKVIEEMAKILYQADENSYKHCGKTKSCKECKYNIGKFPCTQETVNNMPPLTGYRVYYVIPNDTNVNSAYVLYDDKGHPVDKSSGLENMACIIDMKRAHLLYKDVE